MFKEPSPALKRARKRNWYKAQVGSIHFQALGMLGDNSNALLELEKRSLRKVVDITKVLLIEWDRHHKVIIAKEKNEIVTGVGAMTIGGHKN